MRLAMGIALGAGGRIGHAEASTAIGPGAVLRVPVDNVDYEVVGDVRVEMDLTPAAKASQTFVALGNGTRWDLAMFASGVLDFRVSTDGTSGGRVSALSTVASAVAAGQRIQLAFEHLHATNQVNFYQRSSSADPWAKIGATVASAAIFSGTGTNVRSGVSSISFAPWSGTLYRLSIEGGATPLLFTGSVTSPWTLGA